MNGAKARDDDCVRREAHEWRTLISSPHATPEDVERFEFWCSARPEHLEAYERADRVFSRLSGLNREDIKPHLLKPTWQEILSDRFLSVLPDSVTDRSFSSVGATAAALLLVTVSVLVALSGDSSVGTPAVADRTETFNTGAGVIETISLSDQTLVTLSPASRLEARISDGHREITLSAGTAFFDVTSDPNRPFVVSSGELTVTVVGTQFDVRTSDSSYRVSVAEGEVDVGYPMTIGGRTTGRQITHSLSTGQAVLATKKDGLTEPTPIRLSDVGAWREKRLVYDDATIEEVIADVNRFDERLIALGPGSQEIGELRLSGSFNAENIDGILTTLEEIYPVERVEANGGQIMLLPRGND